LASTPALFAGRDAVRAVVFAALRACCWRPRAWPPFFAAALRLVDEPELDALVRLRDDADDERLLAERVLLARLPPDALLPDALLPDDLLPDDRPPDDRLVDARLLEELDRFDPPLDLPVLRRSAILAPPRVQLG
jgi:hypothetical protein